MRTSFEALAANSPLPQPRRMQLRTVTFSPLSRKIAAQFDAYSCAPPPSSVKKYPGRPVLMSRFSMTM